MSGGGQPQGQGQMGGAGQASYMMNGPGTPGATPTAVAPTAQATPQWLRGMQLGTQLAQQGLGAAAGGQRPPMQGMQPHPMMGSAPPQGMLQGAVPGMQGMAPPMASGGMGMGTNMGQGQPMGMQGQTGGINPQLLQMLMRSGISR